MLQMRTRYDQVQGDQKLEVKNKIEILFQRRDLQGDRQPCILLFQLKEDIHRITWLINKNF